MKTKYHNKKYLFNFLNKKVAEILTTQQLSIEFHLGCNPFKKQFVLLIISLTLMLSSCTWNASIKSLNETSALTSSDQFGTMSPECDDDVGTSVLCKVSQVGKIVTSNIGSSVTSWSNPTFSDTITGAIPDGYYSGQTCSLQDTNLIAANIKNGTNIFGVTGSYVGTISFQTTMASSALRDAGIAVIPNLTGQTTSNQITLDNEQNTYAGADLPTTSGYNYRDIPDMTKDDEGSSGTTCKYAPRPASDCGTTQNTIASRISDCVMQNPTASSWNGSTQCSGGQGSWKLVTRYGANKEVWQDQRTGQLWSSTVTSAINWCQASGNIQMASLTYTNAYNNTAGTPVVGNGTIGLLSGGSTSATETITITFTNATTFTVSGANCGGGAITGGVLTTTAGSSVTWSRANYCSFTLTQGATNFAVNDKFALQSVQAASHSCAPGAASGLQPASPISYCAEEASVNASATENWGTGVYLAAKGGMGKTATAQSPSIRWRLPSINDYKIADVNGIRFVMPDMGIAGTNRQSIDSSVSGNAEWSASLLSSGRISAWSFNSSAGYVAGASRNLTYSARCVGR